MMPVAAQKKPVQPVRKPYLTGSPADSSTIRSALTILGTLLLMGVAFLFFGAVLLFDQFVLRLITNALVYGVALLLYYNTGAGNGAIAVNNGEIMLRRLETDREVTPEERARCYHPLKGLIIGLLGCAPLIILALILAFTAERQMTSIGVLPSWVAALESREEIGRALAYYHQPLYMGFTDWLRVGIRIGMMPLVNIIGSENPDGLLLLERLSPLIMALPGLFYGLGYRQGTEIRTKVHTDIAAGQTKRKKKDRRERKQRQTGDRGRIERLN